MLHSNRLLFLKGCGNKRKPQQKRTCGAWRTRRWCPMSGSPVQWFQQNKRPCSQNKNQNQESDSSLLSMCWTFHPHVSFRDSVNKHGVLTAALTDANSTTALPFFLLDTMRFKTSPYYKTQKREQGKRKEAEHSNFPFRGQTITVKIQNICGTENSKHVWTKVSTTRAFGNKTRCEG